ncbi:MAG: TerB N-terminal domain-containing protein [Cellvibrionales bacterium]|nr:TerB N-terminal domain-containing protein [Cellvibrionales bacterium]
MWYAIIGGIIFWIIGYHHRKKESKSTPTVPPWPSLLSRPQPAVKDASQRKSERRQEGIEKMSKTTTRDLLHQFAKQMLVPGQEFSPKDAVRWCSEHGPDKSPATVIKHVRGMAINDLPGRKYINRNEEWNLFFKIDKDRFHLWNEKTDGPPQYPDCSTPQPVPKTTVRNHPAKRTLLPSASSSPVKSGWIPADKTVQVAGRNIGGMVYIGKKCRLYINPSLQVSQTEADKNGDEMPYWPGYSGISPRCRAAYLDWLASGRSNASYNPGYMFLYFYGLERRFFLDKSDAKDKQDILREVQRLKTLYSQKRGSVQRYLSRFIQFAQVYLDSADIHEPVFENHDRELPLTLKCALGTQIERGKNLTADWLLSWFFCHPESNLRTPATRCRNEFIELFRLRFNKHFPNGLKVNKPREPLAVSYYAASSEFEYSANPTVNGKSIPDISNLHQPIIIAQALADEVMEELDKLSRFLARNPDGQGSVAAHALLPPELWVFFPSAEMDRLKAWASDIVERGGLVPLRDVIRYLASETSEKIGKPQITAAADALARIGFGLAPDPRFALRFPKPAEPVVLFSLGEPVAKLEAVSNEYRQALLELALGSFIVHADDELVDAERKMLDAHAKTVATLSDHERRRLHANLKWFLTVPPDMPLLQRKLKDIDPDNQATIRSALISAAHADGIIHPAEVAGIEKVYQVLGLDPALASSDLHAGEIADAPHRVRVAQPGRPGEAIPEPEKTSGPQLDATRIAAIRSDTEQASTLLGQIFGVKDEPETAPAEDVRQGALAGLDPKHGTLVLELIEREHWSDADFTRLCATHGLMESGALEVVNEWAFELYNEALLDEYNGYHLSAKVAGAIHQEMETKDVATKTT